MLATGQAFKEGGKKQVWDKKERWRGRGSYKMLQKVTAPKVPNEWRNIPFWNTKIIFTNDVMQIIEAGVGVGGGGISNFVIQVQEA